MFSVCFEDFRTPQTPFSYKLAAKVLKINEKIAKRTLL